jgi:hypothetical protein
MPKFNSTPKKILNNTLLQLNTLSIITENKKIIYKKEFYKDTAVWEKYTLKKHIQLVLNQFFKYDYYDNDFFPRWMNKKAFTIMLILHDIGKPFSIEISNKINQGTYNKIFVKDIMLKLKIRNTQIYSELVSEDMLGKYIKEETTLNKTVKNITKHANECKFEVTKFYTLLKIYYMCDASSYTKNSGGKESLDWMFIFDEKNRRILFSEKVRDKIIKLNNAIQNTSNKRINIIPNNK